jgi:hypothetical protein
VSNSEFSKLMSGARLVVYIYGSYDGPAIGNYRYCEEIEYAKDFARFSDIGECDSSKPFPQ